MTPDYVICFVLPYYRYFLFWSIKQNAELSSDTSSETLERKNFRELFLYEDIR